MDSKLTITATSGSTVSITNSFNGNGTLAINSHPMQMFKETESVEFTYLPLYFVIVSTFLLLVIGIGMFIYLIRNRAVEVILLADLQRLLKPVVPPSRDQPQLAEFGRFTSPQRRERVDYQRFSETVEETMTQGCLERVPLINPLQHLPSRDGDRNFLNFEERHLVSMALEKLAVAVTPHLNLESIFQDYDQHRGGTMCKQNFCRVLSTRGLDRLLSTKEMEMVVKFFGIERGKKEEVDYRAFCQAIRNLHIDSKQKTL